MKSRKMKMAVNWMMLIALLVVFISGILLKPMPGMWMGITHGISGFVLIICAVLHGIQHNMFKFKK